MRCSRHRTCPPTYSRKRGGNTTIASWWSSRCSLAPTSCITAYSAPWAWTSRKAASAVPTLPVIVVEDDPFTRLVGIVLDPETSHERVEAFADFMSPDEPDFAGWIARVRE